MTRENHEELGRELRDWIDLEYSHLCGEDRERVFQEYWNAPDVMEDELGRDW
jgi:hypothetical protein